MITMSDKKNIQEGSVKKGSVTTKPSSPPPPPPKGQGGSDKAKK